MVKKKTTKPIKDSKPKDSIPLRVCVGSCIDMGVDRDLKSHRFDEPESPGRRKRKVPMEEEFEVLENKLDFGFTLDNASYRSPDAAIAARLKKMTEKLEAKKKKS